MDEMSREQKNSILKERAKLLAKRLVEEETDDFCIEVVEFQLSHERYGIEAQYISEVYPLKGLTPLPFTPPFVMGIINVRGQILSVMDIKIFFDLPVRGITDLNKVIILKCNDMEIGILADMIIGVQFVPARAIQPPLPTLTGIRADYLKGITGERLIILDARKLLADKNIIVHEIV